MSWLTVTDAAAAALGLKESDAPLWRVVGSRVRAVRAWTEADAAHVLANRVIARKYGSRASARVERDGASWRVEGWQTTRANPNTSVRVGRPFTLVLERVA